MFTLPTSVEVEGELYEINTDFRQVLGVLAMFQDPDMLIWEKHTLLLSLVYKIIPENRDKAIEKAIWFIDGGRDWQDQRGDNTPLYSFAQDRLYIFAGVDKVLGYSSRSCDYLHWWDFLGAFMEVGESSFAGILRMRKAHKEGKLSKEEEKAWRENPEIYQLENSRNLEDEILEKLWG